MQKSYTGLGPEKLCVIMNADTTLSVIEYIMMNKIIVQIDNCIIILILYIDINTSIAENTRLTHEMPSRNGPVLQTVKQETK